MNQRLRQVILGVLLIADVAILAALGLTLRQNNSLSEYVLPTAAVLPQIEASADVDLSQAD